MDLDFLASLEEEDMVVDEGLGYPKAYAKLCRERAYGVGGYGNGPPLTFTPYATQQHEITRARQLEQMFPVIDPRAKPTTKPKIFVSLLWKQLSHLGNAGFDPAVIRVDPYGNVLYFHADKASPLAWDIGHWFPCHRGGLTVPSNLRILQWQVCKRKHNKLEFLVPWWDLQLGISVNQFLSIFASSNSDFRRRAFLFLFLDGENEEMNASQTVESHSFPQPFMESKEKLGLAPAAIVVSQRESFESSFPLRSLDYNRQIRSQSPAIASRKMKPSVLKENENPEFLTNPYQAIVMARDSLKQREEAQKMKGEIQVLDEEVDELRRKNDEEKVTIQDLEMHLIKRRRRAEKCRRLAEAQSSYRTMLEKMIRDAMHQSVVYKGQVRLNQAASNALMARLEAQKAICDASEKELHKKFKLRDELETKIRPEWDQGRKRSRIDDTLLDEDTKNNKTVLYLPGILSRTPLHKELRVFLEEEQKAAEVGLPANEGGKHEETGKQLKRTAATSITKVVTDENNKSIVAIENEIPIEDKLQGLEIDEMRRRFQHPVVQEQEREEDEEGRKQRGKGNVERWLQILLESSQDQMEPEESKSYKTNHRKDDTVKRMNQKFPQEEARSSKDSAFNSEEGVAQDHLQKPQRIAHDKNDKGKRIQEEIVEIEANVGELRGEGIGSSKRFEGKERVLARSESARTLRRIPSSPSLILGGMRKGVESITKSSIKTIKKAVKI